eukprot:m.156772 g.156772  ORF g.156772 m.156772 type:complete len:116 (-) comp14331_c2_seq6:3178-3525(-)
MACGQNGKVCRVSRDLHEKKEDCKGPAFDINELDDIRNQMDTDWPSCVGSGSNEDFWKHEWTKHGTCSGMDQITYFKTVLRLYALNKDKGQTDICFDKQLNNMQCPNNNVVMLNI